MGKEYEKSWIWNLGTYLVCEILKQMASIELERCEMQRFLPPAMDTVYGKVDGAYQMSLQFRAERSLFRRLAENMMGEVPKSEELVQEYAKEFVNTLCGRFISEIYHMTAIPARFYPVEYVRSVGPAERRDREALSTICFMSDKKEYVEFSWPMGPMEELLKRSERK